MVVETPRPRKRIVAPAASPALPERAHPHHGRWPNGAELAAKGGNTRRRSNLRRGLPVLARRLETSMIDDPRAIPGVSDEVEALLTKAVRCRRLTAQSLDEKVAEQLKALALECETRAAEVSSADKR